MDNFGKKPSISLLQKSASLTVNEAPFPHVVIENALDHRQYETLVQNFPDTERIRNSMAVLNRDQMQARDLVTNPDIPEIWREFARYHVSKPFFLELLELFAPFIRSTYPWLERSLRKSLAELSCGVRDSQLESKPDVSMDCQPGLNTISHQRESVRSPHLDANNKLLTGLFYMKIEGDESTGGDLELFRTRRKKVRFSSPSTPLERDIEKAVTIPYQANTAVFFLNSPISVHGVSPRDATPIPRRLVNLIASLYSLHEKQLFSKPRVQSEGIFARVFNRSQTKDD